jgi:hypothetical protein
MVHEARRFSGLFGVIDIRLGEINLDVVFFKKFILTSKNKCLC